MPVMDITVIVLTYNSENTIARTLDSILSQRTTAEFEILIGDDCSSDGTDEICRRYAERYPLQIRYIRRPQNLGLLRNYFDCVLKARGKYIADCAGDDFWVNECKLQSQFEILESEPDVTMVLTEWLAYDEVTGITSPHPGLTVTRRTDFAPGQSLSGIISHRLQFHLCSALYSRQILIDMMAEHPGIIYNPDFIYEDQQILLLMASKGKVVLLPEISMHYSVRHESISHSVDYCKQFEYTIRSIAQTKMLVDFFNCNNDEVDKSMNSFVNHAAAMALRSRKKDNYLRLREFIESTGMSLSGKGCIYMKIMRCGVLWCMSANFLNRIRK